MGGRGGEAAGSAIESKANLPYFHAMTQLTVTAKGQVTLRKEVLEHLGVGPGDKIEVEKLPGRGVAIRALNRSGKISDLSGVLKRPGQPRLSVEEMNEIIADAWAGKR